MAFYIVPHEQLTQLSLTSAIFANDDVVPDGKLTAIHWDILSGYAGDALYEGARVANMPMSRPVALANDFAASEDLSVGMLLAWNDDLILDLHAWPAEKRRQHFKSCEQDALFAGITLDDMERELESLYQLAIVCRQDNAVLVQRLLHSIEPMSDEATTMQRMRRERFSLIVVILIVAGMIASHFLSAY